MTTMTLAVADEMKQKMNTFPEINWSEVARQAFSQKLEDLEFLQKFKEKSKLTEADAMRLGAEVSKAVSEKLRKKVKY
ncbi:MAG: hypothetical protein ABH824_00080 [Nanoarchaeota archaeon]